LADEEDKMGLLVEQYKQGGDKILSRLEQRHENQRVAVVEAINQKRAEMVSIYSEATEFLRETTESIKENTTSQFEREWRKKQDTIRDEISEGRKITEL
jgi:F0F1-type ATP synthase membrane subunit b/b'